MCTSRPLPPARELTGPQRPFRLLDLGAPPPRLVLHGELPRGPAVAVVGTRHPSAEAEAYARELAAELSASGVAILSGGAKGIDAAAHLGALDAGGPTVVVAPAGLERPFPEQHVELFRRVLQAGGAYLSACDPHTPADYASFFGRNAIMAALCDALIVVEAPVRSGARNAAQHARALGRALFVVPSPPWNPCGLGCIIELKLGARPLFSHRDVLRALAALRLHPVAHGTGADALLAAPPALGRLSPPPSRRPHKKVADPGAARPPAALQLPLPSLPPDSGVSLDEAARVERALERGANSIDAVCDDSGLELRRVHHVIALMVTNGALRMDADGSLRRPA